MNEAALESLPQDHPLRNATLIAIGAEYKFPVAKNWRPVLASFKIARCCFNDLGEAWVKNITWRATVNPQSSKGS